MITMMLLCEKEKGLLFLEQRESLSCDKCEEDKEKERERERKKEKERKRERKKMYTIKSDIFE